MGILGSENIWIIVDESYFRSLECLREGESWGGKERNCVVVGEVG